MTTAKEAFNPEPELEVEVPTKEFNFQDYVITQEPKQVTLTLPQTKETFNISYKELSWSRRNQILSRSITWDDTGGTAFDGDAYVRACLKEMIVEAPWGRTTEAFLLSIDGRLGSALEELVPKAFVETGMEETQAIKKE